MIFFAWVVSSIVLPVLLPVVGMMSLLLLLGQLTPKPAGLHIMAVVKDGQLCWAVIGMGTSAFCEIWEAIAAHRAVPVWSGLAQIGLQLLMLPAMVLAAGGAVFQTPLRVHVTQPGVQAVLAWARHYVVFVVSLLTTFAAAALVYAALHDNITH